MRGIKFFLAIASILLINQAQACCWQDKDWFGEVAVLGDYRSGQIGTRLDSFSSPDVLRERDKLRVKNMRIWDVGVRGRFERCGWFVRGYALFGHVQHGKYRETATNVIEDATVFASAKANHGHTRDYLIGAGYLFDLNCNLRLGPAAGWSYSSQQVKMKDSFINGDPNPLLNGLKYDMRWQGAWVGLEAIYNFCCAEFRFDYEYHIPHWHANWDLAQAEIVGGSFSDRRRSHDAFGNVFSLLATYPFYCVTVGVGVGYEYWRARHGKETPKAGSFEAVGLPSTEKDKVRNATWESYNVRLELAYRF